MEKDKKEAEGNVEEEEVGGGGERGRGGSRWEKSCMNFTSWVKIMENHLKRLLESRKIMT